MTEASSSKNVASSPASSDARRPRYVSRWSTSAAASSSSSVTPAAPGVGSRGSRSQATSSTEAVTVMAARLGRTDVDGFQPAAMTGAGDEPHHGAHLDGAGAVGDGRAVERELPAGGRRDHADAPRVVERRDGAGADTQNQ